MRHRRERGIRSQSTLLNLFLDSVRSVLDRFPEKTRVGESVVEILPGSFFRNLQLFIKGGFHKRVDAAPDKQFFFDITKHFIPLSKQESKKIGKSPSCQKPFLPRLEKQQSTTLLSDFRNQALLKVETARSKNPTIPSGNPQESLPHRFFSFSASWTQERIPH